MVTVLPDSDFTWGSYRQDLSMVARTKIGAESVLSALGINEAAANRLNARNFLTAFRH